MKRLSCLTSAGTESLPQGSSRFRRNDESAKTLSEREKVISCDREGVRVRRKAESGEKINFSEISISNK